MWYTDLIVKKSVRLLREFIGEVVYEETEYKWVEIRSTRESGRWGETLVDMNIRGDEPYPSAQMLQDEFNNAINQIKNPKK